MPDPDRATTAQLEAADLEQGHAMVRSLAAKIYRCLPVKAEIDDLIAYGEIGLYEAARDFDAARGTKFTTFAFYRVRGAIYDGLSKMCWTSRARFRKARFEQMANEIIAEEESGPAAENLREGVQWLGRLTQRLGVVYLASQMTDSDQAALENRLAARAPTAATIVANRELSQVLRNLVNELPSVQARLITTIYFDGASLKQAADRLGISRSWASRMHAKVLDELGRKLRRSQLD